MQWFTSDLHLGHANIIKYANRPFSSVSEMDNILINNWNDRISKSDIVYILGDIALTDVNRTNRYISSLNGQKYLIIGNHDKNIVRTTELRKQFVWLKDVADIKIGDQHIVLCHYAMRVWNRSHHGAWHLYGHSHGTLPDDPSSLSFDVGVDAREYRPISFDEVAKIMATKNFKPIDHHGQ